MSSTADTLSQRLAAIDQYQIVDTPPEADFDAIIALAAEVCGTPFAALSFVLDDRQWFKSKLGLPVRQTPIAQSFCAHALLQDELFVVDDTHLDPRFATNALVTGEPRLRFYAGVRLFGTGHVPIAALCVLDDAPRPGGLTAMQRATLKTLARQIETQLELRRSIIQRDLYVTEQESMMRRLRWTADHDPLTGLANRALFNARLTSDIEAARRNETRLAVVVLDIDHFKQINDNLGHDAGDSALRACRDRLLSDSRPEDTAARLGGDEFAMILPGMSDNIALQQVTSRLLERLRAPLSFDGAAFDCRASIGTAFYPVDAAAPEQLLKCGDLALAAAKAAGRDRAVAFDTTMARNAEREEAMLRLARRALDEHAIVPHYQPKVDLRTGAVRGLEALLRLHFPDGRALAPVSIEAAFHDAKLSRAIGSRMLELVLADIRRWTDAGVAFEHVAINISAADFIDDAFAERVLAALCAANIAAPLLQIEVTESVFIGRGSSYVKRALTRLSEEGASIALDDFGTGFASLTHLKEFKIDVLKIDRSFVAGLGVSSSDAAIVNAVVALASSLGIKTVAEGIETAEQESYIRLSGCTFGQGFLFGAAQPAANVPRMIASVSVDENRKADSRRQSVRRP